MNKKIKVAVLFGGRSTEHEISLLSAQNVIRSLDQARFEAVLIGIDKQGRWHYQDESLQLLAANDPSKIQMISNNSPVVFSQNANEHYISTVGKGDEKTLIDVIFPVLHGTYGEDGAIQGLAKLANIPCVGPGILGSAIGMDKEVMKRLLSFAGIPNAPFVTCRKGDLDSISYAEVTSILGTEIFIKPANLGSSVGVTFVKEKEQFLTALEHALQYDHKVIIESRIVGRELECAVLGNENPIASIPGEVIPSDSFYSYESKYIDESGALLKVPAEITDDEAAKIKELSIKTYKTLECSGMARVDMFMTDDRELIINEINTIPGFTDISMYPKLWELSGISNVELVSRLIDLAIDEHSKFEQLKLSVR